MRTKTMVAVLSLAALVPAQDKKDPKTADGMIKLEIKGTVTTGIVAIGGETTGVLINTKQGFACELEGANDEKYNKKTCIVSGTFGVRGGVEVRNRSILKVDSIKAAEEKEDENYVKATIAGKVTTGVAAPGGATTGTTITAGGATWELDFGKNKEFAELAQKLNGKNAEVIGTVEVKRNPGTTVPVRTIVTVTGFKAPAEKDK
jgi:hypothetical protein